MCNTYVVVRVVGWKLQNLKYGVTKLFKITKYFVIAAITHIKGSMKRVKMKNEKYKYCRILQQCTAIVAIRTDNWTSVCCGFHSISP